MAHNSLRIELKGESLRKKKAESEIQTKKQIIKPEFYYFIKFFRPHF